MKKSVLPCRQLFRHPFLYFLFLLFGFATLANAQVADFTLSDTVGCTDFVVTCEYSGPSVGPDFEYEWYFGNAPVKEGILVSNTFFSGGTYPIKLIVTNTNTQAKDSITKSVVAIPTPLVEITYDATNACVNGDIRFTSNFMAKDSAFWFFGDGKVAQSIGAYMYHSYDAHGVYPVQYAAYYQGCSDTSIVYNITVDGPIADMSISPVTACSGEPIEFTMIPVSGVETFSWDLGEGDIQTVSPASHVYDTMGYMAVSLTVSGASGTCTIIDTLYLYEVIANFSFGNTRCDQQQVNFNNTSVGNTNNYWDLGNGNTSTSDEPSPRYDAGVYQVKLSVQNAQGCSDSLIKQLVVNELPDVQPGPNHVICPGEAAQLQVSGGHLATWSPSEGLNDPFIYNPLADPPTDTLIYSVTITDTVTNCSNSGEVRVIRQQGFILGKIISFPADTLLIIGDTVQLHVFDSLGRELSYSWTPETGMRCSDCANPVVQPLETITYVVEVTDTNQCGISEGYQFLVEVTEEYRLGLPEAFTPNDDQVNDIIAVSGWGIKNLLEFRIYNRWGNEVFFTDDIHTGWDGKYENKPQPTGTYVYLIRAEMWDDRVTTKQGTFSLIR
jgi:gliding motility-associated-like protein